MSACKKLQWDVQPVPALDFLPEIQRW